MGIGVIIILENTKKENLVYLICHSKLPDVTGKINFIGSGIPYNLKLRIIFIRLYQKQMMHKELNSEIDSSNLLEIEDELS
jgi:hypothetical protein